MNPPGHDPLLLAGKIVTLILEAIFAIGAVAIALALPAALVFGAELPGGEPMPLLPVTGLLLLVFAIAVALFLFFGRLRAIINTVGKGDPFVPDNASRLNAMAWLLLAAQVLMWPASILALVIVEWANQFDEIDVSLEIDGLDLTGILMVLVLFILARVFRQGAAMRDDLEGTV
ncbi:MAG: DUF2975 domain-containing protein [Erythrobacter sp.]|nr:DUF2975 domain-containing protein [Erythrobacter sp.]